MTHTFCPQTLTLTSLERALRRRLLTGWDTKDAARAVGLPRRPAPSACPVSSPSPS